MALILITFLVITISVLILITTLTERIGTWQPYVIKAGSKSSTLNRAPFNWFKIVPTVSNVLEFKIIFGKNTDCVEGYYEGQGAQCIAYGLRWRNNMATVAWLYDVYEDRIHLYLKDRWTQLSMGYVSIGEEVTILLSVEQDKITAQLRKKGSITYKTINRYLLPDHAFYTKVPILKWRAFPKLLNNNAEQKDIKILIKETYRN